MNSHIHIIDLMKFKQRFPLVVMIALSAVLLIVLPLVNLFALRSQKDVLQQLGLAFQFRTFLLGLSGGLWKAALILACVWLGAGIHGLLLRIKDSAKRRLVTTGVMFASLFLCVALPLLGLFLTYKVSTPKEEWRPLPSLPETPKAITGVSNISVEVITEDGNYFSCRLDVPEQCWQGEDLPELTLPPNDNVADAPASQPSQPIIQLVGYPAYPGAAYNDYYALLQDHTVWHLENNTGGGMYIVGLLAMVLIPVVIASLLMLAGMGTMFVSRWLAGRIWREP